MVARIFAVWMVGVVCAGVSSSPVTAQETAVPSYCADSNHKANERILETLRKPLPEEGLEYIETPLEEIIQQLRDEYQIEIQVDNKALDDVGVDVGKPITKSLRNISLQSALKLILDDLNLTYIAVGEVLLITTKAEANTKLTICVYPTLDLADPSYKPTDSDKKLRIPSELIPVTNTLIATVASDTWAVNGGGEASIGGMRPGLLVISQTQAVHEEIRNTLAAIRRGKQFAQEHQSAPTRSAMMGGEGGYGGFGMGMGRGGYGMRGGYGGEGGYGGRGGVGYGEAIPGTLPREKPASDDPFAE